MAAEHSVDECLLAAAAMALQQQQPYALGLVRSESDAQPVKPLYPAVPQETMETMAEVSQQQQQLSNAGVEQFGGTGFSFTSMFGSSRPFNDIASNAWDDDMFLDHEDMEVLFGLDELDAFPASTAELNYTSPLPANGLPPALIQPTTDLAPVSAFARQLVYSPDSSAGVAGGNVNIDAVPPAKVQIAKSLGIEKVPAITGRKRLKRYDEVTLLREEAPKLQAQLDMLREFWRQESIRVMQRSTQKCSSRDSRDQTNSVELKWQTIAAQGRDDLAASVSQNEWLKSQFRLQKKALQHIRKLVRKRVISARNLARQLDAFFELDPQQIRIGSTSVFQFLLDDSNAMSQSFEKVQMTVSLRKSEDEDELRYWEMRRNSKSGTFVEMIERYVVPFDRSQVVKALQNLYRKRDGEERVCEFLSSSDDTIMAQFIAGFANSNGSGRVRARYAARTFEHETTESTRFLVTGFIDRLTDTGESRNLVRLHEQTWTLVTSCEFSTPQHPLTVIQKYYTMGPDVTGDLQLDSLWDTKIIQKVLIPTLDLDMDKLQRTLESEMVNFGTKFRRPNARIESVAE